jgi:hypothetical protein
MYTLNPRSQLGKLCGDKQVFGSVDLNLNLLHLRIPQQFSNLTRVPAKQRDS